MKGELPADADRIFRYALVDASADTAGEAGRYRPAFAHLALLAQIPGVDVAARVAAEKGSALSTEEQAVLAERLAAVRGWLESYAPERARIEIRRDALPPATASLSEDQRAWLGALARAAEGVLPSSGDAWQALIFAVAEAAALPAGRAFGALYTTFLGRTNGPRAGWLLASLEPGFVVERLRAAAGWRDHADAGPGGPGGRSGAGALGRTEAAG